MMKEPSELDADVWTLLGWLLLVLVCVMIVSAAISYL